jgi:hypothetical protein
MESHGPREYDERVESRTNLLLVATLKSAGSSSQCRVRNLSKTGALLETGHEIRPGATVIIARGELSEAGEVVWYQSGRCGIHFSSDVHIENWFTEAAGVPKGLPSVGLNRTSASSPQTRPENSQTVDTRISEELSMTARTLEIISEILVKDPVLRMRHTLPMQQLAMCQEGLSELAKVLTVSDRTAAVEEHVRGPMRQRLLRS